MNTDATLLTFWLGQYLVQLPELLVAMVGCGVVLVRRHRAPQASTWALLGFGLALALGLLIPVGQVMSQRWMMESGDTRVQIGYVLTGVSLLWNGLHAVVYALLLVAVSMGRPTPLPAIPPPLPRPDTAGDRGVTQQSPGDSAR